MTYKITFLPSDKLEISLRIAPDKTDIQIFVFLSMVNNIFCGYSLEAPQLDASSECYNIKAYGEIRKKNIKTFQLTTATCEG